MCVVCLEGLKKDVKTVKYLDLTGGISRSAEAELEVREAGGVSHLAIGSDKWKLCECLAHGVLSSGNVGTRTNLSGNPGGLNGSTQHWPKSALQGLNS